MLNIFFDSIIKRDLYLIQPHKKKRFIQRNFDYFKQRLVYLNSLTRYQKYYIPSKVSPQIINDTRKARSYLKTNFSTLDEKCLLTKELKKSIIKADLRYKPSQVSLLKKFVDELTCHNSTPWRLSKFKWVNPFYPLIHLPFDELEAGSLHVDHMFAGRSGTRTVWIPFTNYDYPGLVTKNHFARLLGQYLGEKLGKSILEKFPDINLRNKHECGNWLTWNDTFRHRGLLNNSQKTSIAFMLRFSNKFDSQTWLSIEELRNIKEKDLNIEESMMFEKLLKKAKLIAEELILLVKSNYPYDLKDFKMNLQNSKKILEITSSLDSHKECLILLHIVEFMITEISVKLRKKPTYIWIESEEQYNFEKLHEFIMEIHYFINKLQIQKSY